MIDFIAIGIGAIALIAVVVGIVDAARGPALRRVAAERREQWEARRPAYHGIDETDADSDD